MIDEAYEAEVYYSQDSAGYGFEFIKSRRPVVKAGDDAPFVFMALVEPEYGGAFYADVFSFYDNADTAKALAQTEFPDAKVNFVRPLADFSQPKAWEPDF